MEDGVPVAADSEVAVDDCIVDAEDTEGRWLITQFDPV
jgi:hypothetical protein